MTDKDALFEQTYDRGATPIYSARYDPRFCYGLYVPHRIDRMDRKAMKIIVSVHGTGRMQSLYRDLFAEFAEYNKCIVLAPLFPANVLQDGNQSGYKYMREADIRYDLVMLDMIAEVAERYGIDGDKVLMFGFSGGGHFTHRFTILHPDRILAASVGAPGAVTILDDTQDWWVGIRNTQDLFGLTVDPEAFQNLPIHFVVGDADSETWEITFEPGDRYYMDGANAAGRTRNERIATLAQAFKAVGAIVVLDSVSGATHDVTAVAQKTREFFADVLNSQNL